MHKFRATTSETGRFGGCVFPHNHVAQKSDVWLMHHSRLLLTWQELMTKASNLSQTPHPVTPLLAKPMAFLLPECGESNAH